MFRYLLTGAFAATLIAFAGFTSSLAQEKKEPPKKKPRIAIADITEAAKDPDFAIQGEYVGEVKSGDNSEKIGAQVVAKGLGTFDVKVLRGGLPGAGWDEINLKMGSATRNDDKVVVTFMDKDFGTIANGVLSLKHTEEPVMLKKIERKSELLGKQPPEGATVLFGKEGDEKNWNGGKLVTLPDGKFLDVGVKSKQMFGGFTAHIEFRTPWMPNSTGQQRGNSGVYLQDRYECQVLDSFGLSGENNECGGIYTQHKPKVNMCLPPLSWQTYDINFSPAEFDSEGKKSKNARVTIYHNGVKIHDNVEFPKECPGGQKETVAPGPFQFQNHNDPVVFRNVWVLPHPATK